MTFLGERSGYFHRLEKIAANFLFHDHVLIYKTQKRFLVIFLKIERDRKSSPEGHSSTLEGSVWSSCFWKVLISSSIFVGPGRSRQEGFTALSTAEVIRGLFLASLGACREEPASGDPVSGGRTVTAPDRGGRARGPRDVPG